MATVAQWVAGARPRTLPAALAPVFAGTGIAASAGATNWTIAALCLVVSLSLQIGVNFANDYSDGVRGTDADRVGPLRLVGSGIAIPTRVRAAAFVSFAIAAATGSAVVVLSGHWWLFAIGAAAIAAAWYYTGGKRPYGYIGLGEPFVFVFFGLVAVCGTVYVILHSVPLSGWISAVGIGALATAILVANNLRDLARDDEMGKATLATRLGDHLTRSFFLVLLLTAFGLLSLLGLLISPWVLLCLCGVVPAAKAGVRVARGAEGTDLIGVLQLTGLAELLAGAGLLAGALL